MSSPSTQPVKMPDALVILFFVIIVAGCLAAIVTPGKFAQTEKTLANGDTRLVVDADSFTYVEDTYASITLFDDSGNTTGVLNYAFDGMVSGDKWGSAVGVVAFILIVGGAFGIVMQTGAINNGIMALISRFKNADNLLIPLIFILFSLGGAVFGMGEEAIAFCIVLVPLVVALGYDGITAVLITYVATQIGFATSWMNPFSVAIAQGIADVRLLSGHEFRMLMWLVFTVFGLLFTLRYAKKIKRAPSTVTPDEIDTETNFSGLDKVILLLFTAAIVWVIWGVMVHAYYIPQIASQFFTMGIAIGIVACVGGRMRANDVSDAFVDGARALLPAALIVGMAKGIVLILGGDDVTSPSVLNTILHVTASGLSETGALVSALLMLVFQGVFNFFVASGSGQAAITMPLMAPLADLVGITRQVSVLAFQLGDGLTNLIIPTSASLIGCLGVAKVEWLVWFRFIWKFVLALFVLASAAIMIAVVIGYA